MMRRLSPCLILVTAILVAGCFSANTEQPKQPAAPSVPGVPVVSTVQTTPSLPPTPISQASVSENTVLIRDYTFVPSAITIESGKIVRWENRDSTPHRIIFTDKNGRDTNTESNVLAPSQSWSNRFTSPGTYSYYCKINPEMKGTVIVV